MGNSWTAAYYSMDAEAFGFWLSQYSELEEFRGQILTDGPNVVIPGSVMEDIIEAIPGFEAADEFDVYDQTASGVGHGLSPFEF